MKTRFLRRAARDSTRKDIDWHGTRDRSVVFFYPGVTFSTKKYYLARL
jgi:hypothetical protein